MHGPSNEVLDAFGLTEPVVRLPGGQGETWRSGAVVLKRADAEAAWRAEVLNALPESGEFRVPRPVRAREGAWVAFGWEASELLVGVTDVRRQDEVLTAAAAFHEAVAWREQSVDGSPAYVDLVGPLVAAWRPVELAEQVVHGDLPGNVMFADGLPPAIIDWPVYWRPPSWAAAVAVADALCWYGAEPELAARWAELPEWGQMLVRALIYRMTTDDLTGGAATWTDARRASYAPVIELALSYAG